MERIYPMNPIVVSISNLSPGITKTFAWAGGLSQAVVGICYNFPRRIRVQQGTWENARKRRRSTRMKRATRKEGAGKQKGM